MLATSANQPFSAGATGISDISQVFAGCRSTHPDVTKSAQRPTTSSTAQRSGSPGGACWEVHVASGRTLLLAWGEQPCLFLEHSAPVMAVTPNHCPGAEKPPNSLALHIALLWWDLMPVFCVKVTSVLYRNSGFAALSGLYLLILRTFYSTLAVLATNWMLTSQGCISSRASRFQNRLFFLCLCFIATTISSRKQNFPILPFLVSHTMCVVSTHRRCETKGEKGTQSLGLFTGLKPYSSLDCALHKSVVPLMIDQRYHGQWEK